MKELHKIGHLNLDILMRIDCIQHETLQKLSESLTLQCFTNLILVKLLLLKVIFHAFALLLDLRGERLPKVFGNGRLHRFAHLALKALRVLLHNSGHEELLELFFEHLARLIAEGFAKVGNGAYAHIGKIGLNPFIGHGLSLGGSRVFPFVDRLSTRDFLR